MLHQLQFHFSQHSITQYLVIYVCVYHFHYRVKIHHTAAVYSCITPLALNNFNLHCFKIKPLLLYIILYYYYLTVQILTEITVFSGR
jgi:hypothetical protein